MRLNAVGKDWFSEAENARRNIQSIRIILAMPDLAEHHRVRYVAELAEWEKQLAEKAGEERGEDG